MLLSYKTLAINTGELKFQRALAATQDAGITQGDLDAAELWARDRINLWIIRVAGEIKGAAIVSEFLGAVSETAVDPVIRHLAEKIAAAVILRLVETRDLKDQGPSGSDQLRRKDWTEVQGEAVALANLIDKTKKTIKADGSVRRWGLGRGQQGPVVNGPMTSGSRFTDARTYIDTQGYGFETPLASPDGA